MAKIVVQVVLDRQKYDGGIKEIENDLSRLSNQKISLQVDASGVDAYTEKIRKASNAVNQFAAGHDKAAQSTSKLAANQKRAASTGNEAAASANALEKSYNRLGVTVANFAKYKAFSAITSGIQSSINEMKRLDAELVTVRKVADATDGQLAELSERSFEIGSKYGKTPAAYASGVAEFNRAGYRETAEDLAELSIKTQLVGDLSAETANQFLLATDAAYKYNGSVTELSAVLDGMNAIDNNFATSIEKISVGLGKVAPIAAQAHVGINELAAALGTITAVTQRSGEEAATALRALFLNIMGDTKTEIADGATWTAGEIDGLRQILEKYAPAAVAAAEATGQVINPMEAMRGLAQSMKDGLLTEQELMQMVTDIGGKLRSSQLLAIVQNWDLYESMLTAYQNAAGSADKEIGNMLDGWEAKANRLKTSFTKLFSNLVDSDTFKGGIDMLRGFVELLDTDLGRSVIGISAVTAALSGLLRMIKMLGKASDGFFAGPMKWLVLISTALVTFKGIYDELNPSLDELQQKAEETESKLEAEEQKLGGINKLLEANRAKIAEIESAGPISYTDQQELDLLKAATAELEKQAEVADKQAERARKNAAEAAFNVLDRLGYYDTAVENEEISHYEDLLGWIESEGWDLSGQIDLFAYNQNLSQVIAAYKTFLDLKESLPEDSEDLPAINSFLSEVEGVGLEKLEKYRAEYEKIAAYYETIKEKPAQDLTLFDQQVIAAMPQLQATLEQLNAVFGEGTPIADATEEMNEYAQAMEKVKSIAEGAFGERTNATLEEMMSFAAKWQQTMGQSDAWGAELLVYLEQTYLATQQAEQGSAAMTATMTKSYASLADTLDKATADYDLLRKAMYETNATGLVSEETFNALKAAGIDLGEAYRDDVTGGFKVMGDTLKETLDETESRINDLAGTDLDFDMEGLDAFTRSLQTVQSELDALEKKLSEMGESGDAFRDFKTMYGNAMNLYSEGRTGTNAFAAYADMLLSEGKKKELGNDAEAVGEYLSSSVVTGFMDAADKGGGDLAKYIVDKGFAGTADAFKEVGDQIEITWDEIDWEAFSEDTGLAVDFLKSMLGYIDEYDTQMKDLADANDDAGRSFESVADRAATTENGIKKIKFSDYIKEAAKAGRSAKEIKDDLAALEESAGKGEITLEADVADVDAAIAEVTGGLNDMSASPTTLGFEADTATAMSAIQALQAEANATAGTYTLKFNIATSGKVPTAAAASGTTDADAGPTLVNELGPELIVSRGRAFVADDGRPTVVELEKGDIVYNHLETEALLKGMRMGPDGIASKAQVTDALGKRPSILGVNFGQMSPIGSGPDSDVKPSKPDKKPSGGKGGGGASGGGSGEEEEKEPDWWRIVQDWFGHYTDRQQRAIDRLDYQIELLENDLEDITKPLEKQIDQYERLNDQIDRQTELLERQQDALTKPLQDEIDALEKAKDVQDEQLELAEKQKAVEEARNELQNAQNERTIRYFNEQKGQWEWMADAGRVKDAQDALESAEKDLADYEYEMQIKALERQIEQIEDVYGAKIEELEEQKTANDDAIYDLEQQIQAAEDAYNAAIEPFEAKMQELERKLKAFEEKWAEIELEQEKPEDDLGSAIDHLNASAEEKQAIRDLLNAMRDAGTESLTGVKPPTEQTVPVAPTQGTKAQYDALMAEMGVMFGGASAGTDAARYTTSNVSTVYDYSGAITINGFTVTRNPDTTTLSDLIDDIGIYVQR